MSKVKDIIFEGENSAPSFVMEDDTIKRPYSVNGSLAWFTDEQVEQARKDAASKEIPKEKKPFTLIKP